MLEIVQNFEKAVADFSPQIQAIAGIIFVLAGLFIWLGGLGLRKALAVLIGAACGGIAGLYIAGQHLIWTGLTTIAGIIIAVTFNAILSEKSLFIRFILALCYGIAGTLIALAGMILLLLYKGASPVSLIGDKQPLYMYIVIGMIVFGTFEQLLLYQYKCKKTASKDTYSEDK